MTNDPLACNNSWTTQKRQQIFVITNFHCVHYPHPMISWLKYRLVIYWHCCRTYWWVIVIWKLFIIIQSVWLVYRPIQYQSNNSMYLQIMGDYQWIIIAICMTYYVSYYIQCNNQLEIFSTGICNLHFRFYTLSPSNYICMVTKANIIIVWLIHSRIYNIMISTQIYTFKEIIETNAKNGVVLKATSNWKLFYVLIWWSWR